jgi:predicted regulator of Ras-like GTPase activity (Roadblock/LC7/MglB family)
MAEIVNVKVARLLEETASILEDQGANPYRLQAYRNAAQTLLKLDKPVTEILERQGVEGLEELPAVGESIARFIRAAVETGRLPMLERLRGESEPELLLASVAGIGRKLAERLHRELGIDTLEELESAAHDGRLARLAGFGGKRIAGIVDSLATRLGRVRRPAAPGRGPAEEPSVAELLDVDREYREKAAAGTLRKIAPRRMNPGGEAWLPVLHTARGPRHSTALYSNTPRAHQMGATRDWVVLYYDADGGESQCTVITSQVGRLKGLRIVSGRELECERHYRAMRDRALARGNATAPGKQAP